MSHIVKDKVALITGGASGIGLCYAEELLKNGAKAVSLADINAETGIHTIQKLENEFGPNKAIFVKTDVTVHSNIEDAFKQTVTVFKQLDIVINNVGVMDEMHWERTIAINLNAVICGSLLAMETYLPKYKSGKEGIIVNTSSVIGLDGYASVPIYSATKHGIVGLGKSLGKQEHYETTNIRVLTICPGRTGTNLFAGLTFVTPRFEEIGKIDVDGRSPLQSPQSVAKGLIKAIDKGKSGSIWVIEGDEPAYEVSIPLWTELCV